MALIPVERARIGMVLSEGVTDLRGRLLIPAGKELSERHLECLPMWGVTTITVEGETPCADDTCLEDLQPWAFKKAAELVAEHFQLSNPSHPVIEALIPICIHRRALEIQKEGQP